MLTPMPGSQHRLNAHRFIPWLIPLLAYPAFLPFIQNGFFSTVDGTLHLLRLVVLDSHVHCQLAELRWTPELYLGYGYPVFNFYAPGTYYLAQALHCVGFDFAQALILIFCTALLVAGYGAYRLTFDLLDTGLGEGDASRRAFAALVAATAYLYSPYLLTNVYAREAQPEVCAQALLPWIFWSYRRLLIAPYPQHVLLVALFSLAALALSHNITLLLLPLVLLAYLLFVGWQRFRQSWRNEWQEISRRAGWLVASGGAAISLTAFFWLPLISERSYLSQISLGIAAFYMRSGFWSWDTVLDWNIPFFYRIAYTNPLGIIQVILALLGVLVLYSKQREWRFWTGVTLLCCLGITTLAQPLWISNPLFVVAQFPWRLLVIASLPLALFTAGLPLFWKKTWLACLTSLVAILLIIVAHRPVIDPDRNNLHPLQASIDELTLASLAHFEYDTKALGTGSAHEFLPRWASDQTFFPVAQATPTEQASDLQISLIEAQPLALTLQITQSLARPLHISSFYFPGWQASLDGQSAVTYPEAVKGLLSVDLPAGAHKLRLYWLGTTSQNVGRWISLSTLALLLLIGAATSILPTTQRIVLTAILSVLLIFSLWPAKPNQMPASWQLPIQPTTIEGSQLLGYTSKVEKNGQLHLFPYWYVRNNGTRMRMNWRLLDSADTIVGEIDSEPYFNSTRSDTWLAGTLVDDAYQIGLAPQIKAGRYRLQLQVTTLDDAGHVLAGATPLLIGEIELPELQRVEPVPSVVFDVRFAEQIALRGFDLTVVRNGRVQDARTVGDETTALRTTTLTTTTLTTTALRTTALQTTALRTPIVQAGDTIEYRLYWQSLGVIEENYHSLLHLLTWEQQPLLKRDQLPGTFLNPPRAWSQFHVESERYRFEVPAQTAGGLYRPRLALYGFADGALLPATDEDGNELGDVFLPTVKIANLKHQPTSQPAIARFAEIITLHEAQVSDTDLRLEAGASLTVTLHYQVQQATRHDYRRFVHLHDETLGMAAQNDGILQAGGNPSWSWVAGEWITDIVQLQLDPDAKPGNYTLRTGLYDPAANNQRLEAFTHNREQLLDAQVTLETITVEATQATP